MKSIFNTIRKAATALTIVVALLISNDAFAIPRTLTWQYSDTTARTYEMGLDGTWIVSCDNPHFSVTPLSGTGTMTLSIAPVCANASTESVTAEISIVSLHYNGTVTLVHRGAPEPEPEPEPRPGNWVQRTTFTSADGAASFEDLTYYDGLGYPLQTVAGKAGGTASAPNIVTPIVYDNMRRDDARTYLPFASGKGLDSLVTEVMEDQSDFYSGESRPYTEKVYESSPVGRPLSATREGSAWEEHPATMDYTVNDSQDDVMRFSYDHGRQAVQRDSIYAPCSLVKTTATNEDGQRSVVFTDVWGKTVCSRQFPDDGTVLETSYVYDLKDSLVCVIQPKGMDCLKADTSIDEITLDGAFARSNCFTYLRDGLGRVKRSVVPGGAVTEYAYDDRNRLRFLSTEKMIDSGSSRRYVMIVYDNYDRLVTRNYVRFTGQALEQIRNSLDVTSIPSFTMLRTLYNASYYPFTDGAQSVSGLPFQADDVATTSLLSTTGHRGLLMSETIADVNGITNTYSAASVTRSRAYYYDAKGRVIQMRESDSDGHAATYSTSYDFAGNVTATLEKHTSPGNVTHILKTDYIRDARGRVTSCSRTFDGSSLADVTYGYDALGRLSGKEGGTSIEETYDYDIHGWQTAMNAKVNSTEVFSQMLNYESPSGQGASPRWSGAISGSLSKHYGNSNYSGENYSYDGAGRFTGMTRYSPPVPGQMITVVQEHVERNVEYDANGNIMSLERLMGIRDSHDLAMQYSGNRLVSVTDGNSAPMLYDYDADGNLASDGHTGFEFSYNILNLPMSAEDSADGRTMTYTYLSDGTKLKAVSDGGEGLTYRGSFVYGLSSGGGCTLESVATDEGRIVMDGTVVKDEWHVRDHVGNVRSVVWLNAPAGTSVSASILEQNDYLPFGTRLPGSRTDQSNRYRLGGKEEQDIAGMDLGLLDFGARYYDAYVGRWSAIDPLASSYVSDSPYAYCTNNPINVIDPDGCQWYKDNNGELVYNEGELTEEEVKSKGYTYVGYTYSTNDTYYSLFGEKISMSSKTDNGLLTWEIYKLADKVIINYYTDPNDEDGNIRRYTVRLSNTKKKGEYYSISYGKSTGDNAFSTSVLDDATTPVQKSYYLACDKPNAFTRWFPTTRRAIAAMGMRKAIGCTLTLGNETGMEVFQLTFSDSDAHKMVNCMNKIFGKRAGIKNTRELEDYYKSHGK